MYETDTTTGTSRLYNTEIVTKPSQLQHCFPAVLEYIKCTNIWGKIQIDHIYTCSCLSQFIQRNTKLHFFSIH